MRALLERLTARLVDNWRLAWKFWSVRIAALLGVVATYLLAAPDTLVQVIAALPPELRGWVPPLLGPALTVAIVLVRLWKQGERHD
ncbi:DUF7940 domain-containing protein [Sphingomonas hengshuiensis]|uniref:Uncharacterized protein n=1 Tax=Sphingomonas hengshuiensis TaxID=1609977 RepID=A0A7U4J8N2_9SPHN|nr:hypothetical protein [Sphingomonas hengshuiensis]AJP72259.1 hypothetical protein TS85_11360 [Sphingomonas hengshuiensis]